MTIQINEAVDLFDSACIVVGKVDADAVYVHVHRHMLRDTVKIRLTLGEAGCLSRLLKDTCNVGSVTVMSMKSVPQVEKVVTASVKVKS